MRPGKGEVALLVSAGVVMACSLTYAFKPEATEHAAQTVAEKADEIIFPSDKSSDVSPDEQAGSCSAIETIPLELRVGAIVLPMAAVTELDTLEQTMTELNISNFTLLGHPDDTVNYHGVPTAFADATNSIIYVTETQNSIATTFALDEEGGTVQRVDNLENGAHILPSAQEMALKTPDEIAEIFRKHGEYLASLGVTTVFGPVTDVGTHGADGSRSFSDDPSVVARSATAVIEGLRAAGIHATAKHLPDYGQSPNNSDNEAASVPSIQQLEQYSIPYIAQVLQGAQPTYGMVGNSFIPGLSDTIPASLNPAVYDYIRNTMGFTGVFMTDALNAGSIQSYTQMESVPSQVHATVEAINAGADIAIISLDAAQPVVTGIQQAVASGSISEATINRASTNALEAKGYDIC